MDRDAIDLSKLDVFKLFKKYFIPTLFGMLSISAVTAIDGIFIGQGVGSNGIAAVNLLIPAYTFLVGVGLMIGAGCSVVASIQLSRGKEKTARINVTQALLTATVIGVVFSALMMVFPETTARLLGSSESLMPLVKEYLLWFVPSWTLQMWVTISLFVIRLDGAPRLAMMCSVIAAICNAFLDWLFIFPMGWGLMGAGFATSISIGLGALIAVGYLLRSARRLRLCRLKWSGKSIRLFMRNIGYQFQIGSPALLGEATIAVLMLVGNLVFMHYIGDAGVGAFGIACYYIPFVFMVGNAISQSAQPIISYNFGLGLSRRVAATERIALATALLCGVITTLAFSLFPAELVWLFIAQDDPASPIAVEGLPLFAAGFIPFIINLTAVGYYQSVERALPATLFALLRGFVFLIPCFLLMGELLGTAGLWIALAVSESLTAIAILIFYGRSRSA